MLFLKDFTYSKEMCGKRSRNFLIWGANNGLVEASQDFLDVGGHASGRGQGSDGGGSQRGIVDNHVIWLIFQCSAVIKML